MARIINPTCESTTIIVINTQSIARPSELLSLPVHYCSSQMASGRFSVQWVVVNAQSYNWSKYRERMTDCSATDELLYQSPSLPSTQGACASGGRKTKKVRGQRGTKQTSLLEKTEPSLTCSQQLWLLGQRLHKIKPISILTWS